MKKIIIIIVGVMLGQPLPAKAGGATIFSGKVTAIVGTEVSFSTASAAYYNMQTQNISMQRRYGSAMQISEMMIGDRIEVTGLLRPGNEIAATLVKDLSLYTHTSSVSGKIITINPLAKTIGITNSKHQNQTVYLDNITTITKNGAYATIADLSPAMAVSVKGTWERSSTDIHALTFKATVHLVSIYITGALMVRGADFITVIGSNGPIYGVDIANSQVLDKNGKPILISNIDMDHTIRIWGKHISGTPEIIASKIKDTGK